MHPNNQPDQPQQRPTNQATQPADPEHANVITVSQWQTRHWHKPTDLGLRYYDARLHQDLFGDWLITQSWGRCDTRLGRVMDIPCASYQAALLKMDSVAKKRKQRGYKVICF